MFKKIISGAVAGTLMVSSASVLAMSTNEFDNGMKKGIEYFSKGMYYEARDEFQWFCDYNWGKMNAGQQQYALDYLGAAKQKVQQWENKVENERAVSDSTMISKVIADYKSRLYYPDKCTIRDTQIENIESKEDKLNGIVRRRVYIKATVLGQPMKEDENGNLVKDYEKGGHYSDVNEVAQISYNKNTGKYTINIDGWN